jgi:hypothetical protein
MFYTLYRAYALHFSDYIPITLGPKEFSITFIFQDFRSN